MRRHAWILGLLTAMAVVARAVASGPPTPPVPASDDPAASRQKAVLIAGSNDLPVFDHATEAMRRHLIARRAAPADIQRLSATPLAIARYGLGTASLDQVRTAIGDIHPDAGQSCFIYVTSHGAPRQGLALAPRGEFLTPAALDAALVRGCGNAPTVVIASGCYSGSFAKAPMTRRNRIILTAAREDRPSFGCGAGFNYTVYDRCLLSAIDRSSNWPGVYALIRACVTSREQAMHFRPSEPKAWFGETVRGLPVP